MVISIVLHERQLMICWHETYDMKTRKYRVRNFSVCKQVGFFSQNDETTTPWLLIEIRKHSATLHRLIFPTWGRPKIKGSKWPLNSSEKCSFIPVFPSLMLGLAFIGRDREKRCIYGSQMTTTLNAKRERKNNSGKIQL